LRVTVGHETSGRVSHLAEETANRLLADGNGNLPSRCIEVSPNDRRPRSGSRVPATAAHSGAQAVREILQAARDGVIAKGGRIG